MGVLQGVQQFNVLPGSIRGKGGYDNWGHQVGGFVGSRRSLTQASASGYTDKKSYKYYPIPKAFHPVSY